MHSTRTLKDAGNGQKKYETVIGTVTVDKFVHRTSEQTACNWREITVPTGTYEVVTDGYWVIVRFPGIKTDEHFVNRLFGSTSLADKQGIGEPATAHWQLNGYIAAERFATNPAWELAEDYRVEMRQTYSTYDGKPRKSFKIVAPTT